MWIFCLQLSNMWKHCNSRKDSPAPLRLTFISASSGCRLLTEECISIWLYHSRLHERKQGTEGSRRVRMKSVASLETCNRRTPAHSTQSSTGQSNTDKRRQNIRHTCTYKREAHWLFHWICVIFTCTE